ncbi:MAG: VOC family protein [Sphingomonadales bacterium]|nr:VOC family protein [Sphingomonadales bacterium]
MSRILGQPVHQAYVYPDFDKALARFAAGGIGPFYTMQTGGVGRYRGESHPLQVMVAFTYTGETCLEIMTPNGAPGQQSAYDEFLRRNPEGGLHHIAYYSTDFAATLSAMQAEGLELVPVQEFTDASGEHLIEIYCEPVGVDNPVLYQLLRPGLFDPWFDAMKAECAGWDGQDPVREARPLMEAALRGL